MRVDRWFAMEARFPVKAESYVLERDCEFYVQGLGIFTQTPAPESRKGVLAAPDDHSVPGTFA